MIGQIVPLQNLPNQTIQVTLTVDGKNVTRVFKISYNEIAAYWVLSIFDSAGNLLLSSIPFITGNAPAGNLLAQFAYLGLGGATIINASGVPVDHPNNTNLGTDFQLAWYNSQTS